MIIANIIFLGSPQKCGGWCLDETRLREISEPIATQMCECKSNSWKTLTFGIVTVVVLSVLKLVFILIITVSGSTLRIVGTCWELLARRVLRFQERCQ